MREYRPARWQLCPGRKDGSPTQTSPVEPKTTQPESEAYARAMSTKTTGTRSLSLAWLKWPRTWTLTILQTDVEFMDDLNTYKIHKCSHTPPPHTSDELNLLLPLSPWDGVGRHSSTTISGKPWALKSHSLGCRCAMYLGSQLWLRVLFIHD